jgi:hypothetical protein
VAFGPAGVFPPALLHGFALVVLQQAGQPLSGLDRPPVDLPFLRSLSRQKIFQRILHISVSSRGDIMIEPGFSERVREKASPPTHGSRAEVLSLAVCILNRGMCDRKRQPLASGRATAWALR